jgi:ribonuclease HI
MEKIVENFNWSALEDSHLIRIGCDGSSKGNPGAGGYGWYHSDNLYGFGGSLKATNNAMELEALRSVLKTIPPSVELELILDSKYVIDSLTKYIFAWRKNGYLTSKGTVIANKETIMEIDLLLKNRVGKVKFSWVKGHAGHPLNEAADRLANIGAVKYGNAKIR